MTELLLLLLLHGWFLHLLLLFPSEVGYRKNPEAIRGALASTKNRTKVEYGMKLAGKHVYSFSSSSFDPPTPLISLSEEKQHNLHKINLSKSVDT